MKDCIGFEVNKSYRVKPECYDYFSFRGYWEGKAKDTVFNVDEVSQFGFAYIDDCTVAYPEEFKYCEEVSNPSGLDEVKTTTLDYSNCLYKSPEYLGYYVSFNKGDKKYFGHIVGADSTSPQFSFLIDLGGFTGDENIATHNGFGLSEVEIKANKNTHWYALLNDLTFYQEDGSECKFEELLHGNNKELV